MMDNDGWWWMMMDDDGWWWMMMADDGWWWLMMADDGWWLMMIDDDWWWWRLIIEAKRPLTDSDEWSDSAKLPTHHLFASFRAAPPINIHSRRPLLF
jgi:hypothetical protein